MPVDSDICDKLIALGYGTVKGTDIFYGNLPDYPDNAYCVMQTGGHPPEPWEDLEYPGITILVRHTDSDTARTRADGILADLGGLVNQTINTRKYHYIAPMGSPIDVGVDEKNRKLFTLAFLVTKEMEG